MNTKKKAKKEPVNEQSTTKNPMINENVVGPNLSKSQCVASSHISGKQRINRIVQQNATLIKTFDQIPSSPNRMIDLPNKQSVLNNAPKHMLTVFPNWIDDVEFILAQKHSVLLSALDAMERRMQNASVEVEIHCLKYLISFVKDVIAALQWDGTLSSDHANQEDSNFRSPIPIEDKKAAQVVEDVKSSTGCDDVNGIKIALCDGNGSEMIASPKHTRKNYDVSNSSTPRKNLDTEIGITTIQESTTNKRTPLPYAKPSIHEVCSNDTLDNGWNNQSPSLESDVDKLDSNKTVDDGLKSQSPTLESDVDKLDSNKTVDDSLSNQSPSEESDTYRRLRNEHGTRHISVPPKTNVSNFNGSKSATENDVSVFQTNKVVLVGKHSAGQDDEVFNIILPADAQELNDLIVKHLKRDSLLYEDILLHRVVELRNAQSRLAIQGINIQLSLLKPILDKNGIVVKDVPEKRKGTKTTKKKA